MGTPRPLRRLADEAQPLPARADGHGRLIFLVLEVVVILGFGHWVFDVPLRGSVAPVATLCLVGSLAFAGLGLLVASRARTIEGVSGLMNLAMVPMWVLSGVFFSSENFPAVMQPFINLLPLTALNDALRAVMHDGASLASNGIEVLVLLAWGAVSFVIALRIFRWHDGSRRKRKEGKERGTSLTGRRP